MKAADPLTRIIPAEAGFRHSSDSWHYRRGGLGVVKDAILLASAKPVLRILDKADPLAKLAAKR
jgi:hypothetical protein